MKLYPFLIRIINFLMSHSSLSSAELEKSNYVFFAPTMWNLAELNPRPIALVTVQLAMQWLQLFDIKM